MTIIIDTSEPQPSTGETQEMHEHMDCCRNMPDIILKAE